MRAIDFYNNIFDLLPEAQVETDNEGQIIVYTNMKEKGRKSNGQPMYVVPMDEEN